MTTKSKAEALDVLREYRSALITLARKVAKRIAKENGTVHVRAVRAELAKMNALDEDVGDYWLGAVFNKNPDFEWTGEHHTYADEERNVHEKSVKVWKLKSQT